MTTKLQPIRGTHDILGEDMRRFRRVMDTARRIAATYGFEEISTPIFESTEVFHRTLGETSDVVSKETYTFTDRGGDSITLRPEFTASVVRAFISNGLTQTLPFKAFYAGPAFRYERPQKGRLRQFHQVGIETLGADAPWHDVEAIACGLRVLEALGLKSGLTLEINSLGDAESRSAYREALVTYMHKRQAELSEESRARLEKNPLRILDSKQEQDRAVVKEAPEMSQFFTEPARRWFGEVQEMLAGLEISYTVSPRLVRGLDYYTHTVFEITTDALGAQNTVLAGGRYDGLVEQMGGPDVPGIGWAAGVERLMLLVEQAGASKETKPVSIAVIPVGDAQVKEALSVAEKLREAEFVVEVIARGHVGKAMKKADGIGARVALLLGEEEIATGEVTMKNLASGEQVRVPRQRIVEQLKATK